MTAKKTAKRSPETKAKVLNVNHPGTSASISQEALIALVEGRLTTEERRAIASVGWYVTTVKLDLEARKRIERVPGSNPQLLRRV
jgi:hypothetical protein